MDIVDSGARWRGLAGRVWAVLRHPARTWEVIAAEPATISSLYKGYVAPLAAIPAVCGVLGALMFGASIAGIDIKLPLDAAILEAVVTYGVTLAGVFVLARVVAWLSPHYGGEGDLLEAFKLAAYSGTAVWVVGAFSLLPSIGWTLGWLGAAYSLYLLYVGLPKLMKIPADRTLILFAAVVGLLLVLVALGGLLTGFIGKTVGGPLNVVSLETLRAG